MQEGWGKIKVAGKYAGLSERTMRDLLKQGLKYSKLPTGTILIKFQWIDEFLEGFTVKDSQKDQIDEIVNDTLKDFL